MAKAKAESTDSVKLPREKPSLRVDENDLPQLKNWGVDKEYTLTVKAKLVSLGRDEYGFDGEDKRLWGRFRIVSISSDDGDDLAKGMDSVKPQYVRKNK